MAIVTTIKKSGFELEHIVVDNKKFGIIIRHKDPKIIEALESKIKDWLE